ncbi:MAG: Hsp33 family molecular chaperone HslO [Spirochaetales bacterium]|nr:Hsp33 family molecular chaperone HslO [Spirochaetales bacterium]
MDNMQIFLLNKGTYRGALLDATEIVQKMKKSHNTGVLETYILGENYIAAGLLTSMLKGNDRLAVVFECGGPVKGISVEVSADGKVRGYLKNNPIPLDKKQDDFDLNFILGPGFLSIIKYPEGDSQPFKGQVMIEYGDIAKDLANYFTTSENLPTAFNLSVKFNKDGSVKGAGGLIIQKMPAIDKDNEDESDAEKIEKALSAMPSIGESLSDGQTPSEIISSTFEDFFPNVIGSRNIRFECGCNKELFSTYLNGLSDSDKKDLYENGPFPVKTNCHNCNSVYSFNKEELKSIFNF